MCRMALVLSKGPIKNYEMAFKTAWAEANNEGVGIYWRDIPSNPKSIPRHLARFKESKNLIKVGSDYDRLMIHFRKSTGGEGTHPFTCLCKPNENSGNWLLIHNGSVSDDKAREELSKTHTFSTQIDSECLIHLWAEIKAKTIPERIRLFNKRANDLGLNGWANLILYNVATDEWVALSDGSLSIVKTKDIVIICSDIDWLDEEKIDKKKISMEDISNRDGVWGKGLSYKTKEEIWNIPTKLSSNNSCMVVSEGPKRKNYYEMEYGDGRYEMGEDWTDNEKFQKADGHSYLPSSSAFGANGEPLCKTCFIERFYHIPALDNQFSNPHSFQRDFLVKEVKCKCGKANSYGYIHFPHEFTAYRADGSICNNCERTRVMGNHIEEKPSTHFFVPTFVEKEEDYEDEGEEIICARCGFTEQQHMKTAIEITSSIPNQKITVLEDMKPRTISIAEMEIPKNCECNYGTKYICAKHEARGFRYWDFKGHLFKERTEN